MAQWRMVPCATVNLTVLDSIPTRGMKYIIFPIPRTGNEAKSDIDNTQYRKNFVGKWGK